MFKKRAILFLLVVAVLFSLMTYQSKKGYSLTGAPATSLLHGIAAAVTSVTDAIRRPFRTIAIREGENRALKKQVDELLLERMQYQEALFENRRLRDLLKLSAARKDVLAAARVIGRGTSHWSHSVVLDKGLNDGIVKDSTAITPKGLAGKIYNVSQSYASLLLITDINFSAAVRLQESRKEGILSGTGTGRTVLKYIPPEEEVKPGEVIVSSGLDKLFPAGIPIGYVSKVDRQGTGLFQHIEVVPFVDSATVEEVLIIK
jgi:rod shape-determining protein MreC